MAVIQNALGEMVDMTTGEVVGRAEGAPTEQEPLKAAAPDVVKDGADRAYGLAKQASWGFNSALFAIPDLATKGIGKVLGMDEDQVFTLGKFFNRGEKAPVNAEERYTRAIAGGVGSGLPLTGILSWAALSRPMVTAAQPAAGVLKGIANDAIKFVQRSPGVAAATDIAFNSAYEGFRQSIEENVDDSNPNKELYKDILPAVAFLGVPLALNLSPTIFGAKKGAQYVQGKLNTGTLNETEQEVLNEVRFGKTPVINILPKLFIKNAERKLENVFGPIANSPEAQAALAQLRSAMADPRVANAGFMFDVAEQTLYGPLLSEKTRLLEQLGPNEIKSVKARINENQQKLDDLFSTFSPQARKPVEEAFRAAQADRQAFFESLLRQKKDLTDAEVLAISERLGPQNIDQINNELRGVIMAGMEMDASMRARVLSRMGLREGLSPEGLVLSTRDKLGKSLYDSNDMEDAAISLLQKYTINRPSARTPMPEPLKWLDTFVKTQLSNRARLQDQMSSQLLDTAINDELAAIGKTVDPEFIALAKQSILQYFENAGLKAPTKNKKNVTAEELISRASPPKVNADGSLSFRVIPGATIKINPTKIAEDAAQIAKENTKIDLNVPEALDTLEAAIRFKNDQLGRYNAAMTKGRARITDAQRMLDTGDQVFKDVERLILDRAPRLRNEYDGLKSVIDDYNAAYENSLPLLMTTTKRGGQEFLLPNEDLMRVAFSNAERLRQLQTTLGGGPQAQEFLQRGLIDWLRTKGVVNKEGLVDPKMIRSVLAKNKNIVDSLPPELRAMLDNEVQMAEDYVTRLGQLDQRRVNAMDTELDNVLNKAARPDADPNQTMVTALRDPAVMRKLVTQMSGDPEMLAALRRSVYDTATKGAKGGGALKTFLDTNEKSLAVLFNGTDHLADLKKLADLQRRVNAFAGVTGQIPEFESLDQSLKRLFGSGIQFLTTTMREAAVGRIAPETGALALMVRLASSLENDVYKRIFTKALEDKEFAKKLSSIGTPLQAQQAAAALQSIGVPIGKVLPRAVQAANLEASRMARKEEKVPVGNMANLPVMPATSAREMMSRLPPAPPTTGFNLRTEPFKAPPPPSAPSIPLMYPTLFPNDPISAMLKMRQQQIQQPPQAQPQ